MKYKKTYSSDRSNNNKINIGRARGVILLNFKIFVCMCTFLKFVKNFSDSHVNKSAIYTVSKCEHVVVARSLFEKKKITKRKKNMFCNCVLLQYILFFFHRHYRMVCCWFLLICDSARVSSISVNVRTH